MLTFGFFLVLAHTVLNINIKTGGGGGGATTAASMAEEEGDPPPLLRCSCAIKDFDCDILKSKFYFNLFHILTTN